MEPLIVYGQNALVIYYSTSGRQGRLCFLSQEPELNMERQHLVFMAHISGANPKRGAKSVASLGSTNLLDSFCNTETQMMLELSM